jgi:hypothetical protein
MKPLRWLANASILLAGVAQAQGPALPLAHGLQTLAAGLLPALLLLGTTREGIYNILWGLVFAFATLNILSLGARRFEANKRGLSFGEVLAIMVVVVSVLLLGWELLYEFHILPIRFTPE